MDEAMEWMAQAIAERRPRQIVPINANKLWHMERDARLRELVITSDLIIPEWAVVWGAARLRMPTIYHVAGFTLLKAFIPFAAERGFRPYFLGARPNVIIEMVDKLRRDYPHLEIAGFHHGYLTSLQTEAEAVSDIQKSRPDVLFVAMGTPRQEYWLRDQRETLNVPISMGVGGSFDVIAGLKSDAPAWARGKGLEWLYRLVQEPHAYWKRYLITNPWFVYRVFRARFAHD